MQFRLFVFIMSLNFPDKKLFLQVTEKAVFWRAFKN